MHRKARRIRSLVLAFSFHLAVGAQLSRRTAGTVLSWLPVHTAGSGRSIVNVLRDSILILTAELLRAFKLMVDVSHGRAGVADSAVSVSRRGRAAKCACTGTRTSRRVRV